MSTCQRRGFQVQALGKEPTDLWSRLGHRSGWNKSFLHTEQCVCKILRAVTDSFQSPDGWPVPPVHGAALRALAHDPAVVGGHDSWFLVF